MNRLYIKSSLKLDCYRINLQNKLVCWTSSRKLEVSWLVDAIQDEVLRKPLWTNVLGLQFTLLIWFAGWGHIFCSHFKNLNPICEKMSLIVLFWLEKSSAYKGIYGIIRDTQSSDGMAVCWVRQNRHNSTSAAHSSGLMGILRNLSGQLAELRDLCWGRTPLN